MAKSKKLEKTSQETKSTSEKKSFYGAYAFGTWYGKLNTLLVFLGVVFGGLVGVLIAIGTALVIHHINEKTNYSNNSKIALSILTVFGAIIVYLAVYFMLVILYFAATKK